MDSMMLAGILQDMAQNSKQTKNDIRRENITFVQGAHYDKHLLRIYI